MSFCIRKGKSCEWGEKNWLYHSINCLVADSSRICWVSLHDCPGTMFFQFSDKWEICWWSYFCRSMPFSDVSLSEDQMCWCGLFYWKRVLSSISASASVSDLFCIRISSLQLKMIHFHSNQGSSEMLSAKKSEKYSSVF